MGSTTKVGEGVRREEEAVGEDSSPRNLGMGLEPQNGGRPGLEIRISRVRGFEGRENHSFDCFVGLGDKINSYGQVMPSAQGTVGGAQNTIQFILVSTAEGLADMIISPAFLATSSRVSWISCKSGLSIMNLLLDDDKI